MSQLYTPVTNVREFLAQKGTRKERDHAMTRRACHWPYCQHCGLVALKNEASRKALKGKCITYE